MMNVLFSITFATLLTRSSLVHAQVTSAFDNENTGFSCMPLVAEGYLVDNLCWDMPNHIAIDGADLANDPAAHSHKCMLLPQCVASGYSIITPDPDTGVYQLWANLSAVNASAYNFVSNSNKTNNFLVTVSATVCMDNKQLTGGNLFTMSDEFQTVTATVGLSGGGTNEVLETPPAEVNPELVPEVAPVPPNATDTNATAPEETPEAAPEATPEAGSAPPPGSDGCRLAFSYVFALVSIAVSMVVM